jgi:luciferase family oxidoreductase group 1
VIPRVARVVGAVGALTSLLTGDDSIGHGRGRCKKHPDAPSRPTRGKVGRPAGVGTEVSDLPSVPLSVLDLAPVTAGSTPADALRGTVELARAVEDLGFTRFWVAEHHGMPGVASSAPPVLIGAIADATRRIRVGSGGVMLPNHPPLVVAEQFGTLTALHPGRIDLGLGRAPGTDPVTARALRRTPGPLSDDDFPQQLGELIGFFRGGFPEGHPYRNVTAVPGLGDAPPIWLLGSSGYSAQVAGMLGLPFAFAHHFMAHNTLPALELYRRSFQSSDVLDRPWAMVAAQVIVADTDERAIELAKPLALSFLELRRNNPIPLPTVAQAAAHDWTGVEQAALTERLAGQAIGSPESVRRSLAELLSTTGADELMVTTTVPEPAARLESMRRLRDLFGSAELPQGVAAA